MSTEKKNKYVLGKIKRERAAEAEQTTREGARRIEREKYEAQQRKLTEETTFASLSKDIEDLTEDNNALEIRLTDLQGGCSPKRYTFNAAGKTIAQLETEREQARSINEELRDSISKAKKVNEQKKERISQIHEKDEIIYGLQVQLATLKGEPTPTKTLFSPTGKEILYDLNVTLRARQTLITDLQKEIEELLQRPAPVRGAVAEPSEEVVVAPTVSSTQPPAAPALAKHGILPAPPAAERMSLMDEFLRGPAAAQPKAPDVLKTPAATPSTFMPPPAAPVTLTPQERNSLLGHLLLHQTKEEESTWVRADKSNPFAVSKDAEKDREEGIALDQMATKPGITPTTPGIN